MSSFCIPPPPDAPSTSPGADAAVPRAPSPEVSSADVGHFGAAHGAGLDEVLGRQDNGFDAFLHRQLVVLH